MDAIQLTCDFVAARAVLLANKTWARAQSSRHGKRDRLHISGKSEKERRAPCNYQTSEVSYFHDAILARVPQGHHGG